MADYNNQYASSIKITPNTPMLRGLTTNYSNDGQTNLKGVGLGDLFELDYDRNKIENIFNQGTDAQYAVMQREAQTAENNYTNNQFQNQFNTMEAIRAGRNEQIASGMARGLNAASDQATALGVQQEAMNGALELAQNRQQQADQIAAEYANNVVKALQEANAVKQAMANVSAQLYAADMSGYAAELQALGQLDANAINKYGFELGLEGTQYTADKNLEGVKDYNQKYYDANIYSTDAQERWEKYAADQTLQGYLAQANASRYAADRAASSGSGSRSNAGSTGNVESDYIMDKFFKEGVAAGYTGNDLVNYVYSQLRGTGQEEFKDPDGQLWGRIDERAVALYGKDQTKVAWEKQQEKLNKQQEQQQAQLKKQLEQIGYTRNPAEQLLIDQQSSINKGILFNLFK